MASYFDNSLMSCNPLLSRDWDFDRNGSKTPANVTFTSTCAYWWKCDVCNHSYRSTIKTRLNGYICPVCHGERLVDGVNDLATKSPRLLKYWDYEANKQSPHDYYYSSREIVHWKCPRCNSKWTRKISEQRQYGCPMCYHAVGTSKRKCEEHNSLEKRNPELCVEWHYKKNLDISPSSIAPNYNKPVWWICKDGHEWQASPNNRINRKEGCPYCEHQKIIPGKTDFGSAHTDLLWEWDFEKNFFSPFLIGEHSNKTAFWKCQYGHSWTAIISNRVKGYGVCPICRKGKSK
ncbi:MAG: zinc-ribbon domain-containing protein [Lachnospiraceae bacterium]|nr:zinc-ribbon domain-containing protein [Lachnospiraceae bacterium]